MSTAVPLSDIVGLWALYKDDGYISIHLQLVVCWLYSFVVVFSAAGAVCYLSFLLCWPSLLSLLSALFLLMVLGWLSDVLWFSV
jgi:hypothetical protein